MPMVGRPIVIDGKVVGIACSREQRRTCSTPGCHNTAPLLCDYPVTRKGKPATCDRPTCKSCALHVGKDVDYCAVHARQHKPATSR